MRILVIATALLFAACGSNDDTHGSATDPNAAVGFVTANTTPPETATDSRGDGVLRDGDGRPYGHPLLGQPLPDFTAPMVGGATFSTDDLTQWTILDVWGIWCGDCMADAPYVNALSNAVAQDPSLDFISMHTPPNARRADERFGRYGSVEAYFDETGYSYPVILDDDAALRDLLQIAWTPTYLLISPDGVVRGFRTDLSVAGDQPVKDFLADVAAVRAETVVDTRAALPQMGFDGVGRLRGVTPFTQASLDVAFAPYQVRAASQMGEGVSSPVFQVIEPGMPGMSRGILFTLEPSWDRGHLGAVSTTNAAIAGPGGERVGETTANRIAGVEDANCLVGADDSSDKIVCTSSNEAGARFQWIFPNMDNTPTETARRPDGNALLARMRYVPLVPESYAAPD